MEEATNQRAGVQKPEMAAEADGVALRSTKRSEYWQRVVYMNPLDA